MPRGSNRTVEEPSNVIEVEPGGAVEAAVESLGEAAAHTGDGSAREEEVSQSQERFDALAEGIDLGPEAGEIVRNASAFVIELFKHRPKAWDQLSQIEQRDLGAGIEGNVKELVRQIVEVVVATRTTPVRCLFVGFTDKGDDIKAELKLKALSKDETEDAVLFFHRARGQHVMVTLASADEFHKVPADDASEPDQRALGFEGGSDEHPADDSDLVAAAEPEPVRTGDKVPFAGEIGEVRVNLSKGCLQFLADSEKPVETNWQDMREATSDELAAERDRVADFADA